jgi:hypothetical protein
LKAATHQPEWLCGLNEDSHEVTACKVLSGVAPKPDRNPGAVRPYSNHGDTRRIVRAGQDCPNGLANIFEASLKVPRSESIRATFLEHAKLGEDRQRPFIGRNRLTGRVQYDHARLLPRERTKVFSRFHGLRRKQARQFQPVHDVRDGGAE